MPPVEVEVPSNKLWDMKTHPARMERLKELVRRLMFRPNQVKRKPALL
jgi:hypothetical protein